MPLDAIVTDLSTVPEALHSEYKEADGKFVLQVKPVDGWDLQDIGGLTRSLQAERALKTQAEKALAPYKDLDAATARAAIAQIAELEGLTPAEVKQLKTDLEALRAADPKAKTDEIVESRVTAAKTEWEKTFGSKQTEWQTALDAKAASEASLKAQLKALLVDNDVKTEFAKVKLVEGVQPAAEMLISRFIQVVEKDGKIERVVVDAEGNPRTKLEGSRLVDVTIGDLVAELKQTTPGLFQAEERSGVGIAPGRPAAGSGGQINPWSKETWNQTEQAKLRLSNPTLAAQYKAAAGK